MKGWSRDNMISRQQEVENLNGTTPRGTKQITASKGPMGSQFHTEVWVGLWNVSSACPPSPTYPVPQSSMPARDPAKPISASTLLFKPTPCLECSHSLSFNVPIPSHCAIHHHPCPTGPQGGLDSRSLCQGGSLCMRAAWCLPLAMLCAK